MSVPNLDYIKSLAGGDTEFENHLISIIKDEFPKEREVYQNNNDGQLYDKAAENVHKLKHKISILGMEDAYHEADTHEELLKTSDSSKVSDFEKILNSIEAFLANL